MKVVTLARKPIEGSVTRAVIEHGCGAMSVDKCRIATAEKMSFSKAAPYTDAGGEQGRTWNPTSTGGMAREQHEGGRWPANMVLQGEAACADLDGQSGVLRARGNLGASKGGGGMYGHGLTTNDFGAGDAGGASRFFLRTQIGSDLA